MDEEIFVKVGNAAGVEALRLLQKAEKMSRYERDFCRAVIEMMKSLMQMDRAALGNCSNTRQVTPTKT